MRSFLYLAMPVLGFLAALGGALLDHRGTVASEIARCISQDCFDHDGAARLKDSIVPFTRGTRFDGKLNTDGPPREGYLNLYVTRSAPVGRLAPVKCNCAFVGESSIVCDRAFLETFAGAVSFTREGVYGRDADAIWTDNKAVFEQVNRRIAEVLKAWILGHEIGHAVLHAESNFGRRRPFSREQEAEADRFFIERAVAGAGERQIQDLYFGLTQIVFAVMGIAMNLPAEDQNGPRQAVIAPSMDGIHEPWLVRALKLGGEIGEIQGKSDDFYSGLASKVVERKGGLDVGTFCAFQNLREIQSRLQEQRLRKND